MPQRNIILERVEIGVVMDDGRRFAAQFQHARHHVLRRRRGDGDARGTEPVNTIWLTPDARTSAAPASCPRPAEHVDRPFRQTHGCAARANQALVSGVSSGDLITQALPVASAADSERAVISTG
jgi:hypothetical protein